MYQFFLNGGAEAKVVRVVPVGGNGAEGATAATLTLGEDANGDKAAVLRAKSVGGWGASLRARVDQDATDFNPQDAAKYGGQAAEHLYNLTVRDLSSGVTEQFTSINNDKGAQRGLGEAIQTSTLVELVKPDDPNAGTVLPAPNVDPEKIGQDPFDPAAEPKPAEGNQSAGPRLHCQRRR